MKNIICLLLVFDFLLTISAHDITAQIKPKEYKITNSIDNSRKDLKIENKNPFQAGIASFIVPGFAFGQLYNEQYDKFAIHVGITLGCAATLLLLGPNLQLDIGGKSSKRSLGIGSFVSSSLC